MNARISYKPSEKDEILLMPNMSFQKNNSNSISTGVTFLDGEELNSSETTKHTESHGYNISGELLWRHKFNKDGRTFSANIKGGLNKNDSESDQTIILNGVSTEQKVDNNSNGHNYGANLMYTEPISDNQQLSLSYNANFTNSTTDKITDEIAESGISHDPYLTSNYSSDYFTQSAGAGYRLNSEKIRFMVNLNYQRADLNGHQYFPYKDEMNYKTSKSFNSFLPMVMFDFIPEQNKSLRFMYRSSSTSPSVTQLQQTIDNSNPLQLSQGNPELDQIVDHTLSVRYITSNIDKATNWMFNVNLTKKFDYIGSSVFIADEELTLDNGLTMVDGAQMTTPVNLNGYLSTGANASFGFPLDFIMSNMNVSAAINYIKTPGIQNDVKLNTKSLSVVPGLSITSNISQDIDFTLNYDIDFQKVKNTINKESNYNYLTHSANAKVNWVIWNGIIFENNLNWKYYGGSSMDKAEQIWRWNVSIGKKFLKNNRAELKVIAYDILNQNRSFSRTVTDTYIQNSYTNVLGRYFMLSLTYNLQNFKKTTPKT